MALFTYYCGEHRDQRQIAGAPSDRPTGAKPVCPICFSPMFWVPNGGTEVPPVHPFDARTRFRRVSDADGLEY